MNPARLVLATAPFYACATAWYLQYDSVNIVSSPPGARVEMNNEYVGRTPLTIRHRRGGAHGQANRLVVRALAATPPGCSESRIIAPEERTPGLIYFELGTCSKRSG